MRVILTAGYDRAPHVSLLAQALLKDGVEIAGILCVSALGWQRARAMLRQRGLAGLLAAARKLRRSRGKIAQAADPLAELAREWGMRAGSLRAFARRYGVAYAAVPSLNARRALAFIDRAAADGIIYGGGGIVGSSFIDAAKGRVLNAHSGPLPQVRGMNAVEWSCMLGFEPTTTIHYVDRGIDTGPIVEARKVRILSGDDIEMLRGRCAVEGVRGLRAAAHRLRDPLPLRTPGASDHRQCFIMAPALRAILDRRLAAE